MSAKLMEKPEHNNSRVILVTGAAGFIGSTFANYAVRTYPNDTFILLDALTPVADLANIDEDVQNASNARVVIGDIRDKELIEKLVVEHGITDIINFAAESHVDQSIKSADNFISTNVAGTHILLEAARRHQMRRFHQISTDEVYGSLSATDPAFTELSPLAPNNPYSASKAAADCFVRSYQHTFGLNTAITRCSNNYGPRQDRTKLIPLFTLNLLEGKTVPLYGQGENIRDWIYVDDHVRAIDLVFRNGTSGEIYNVGSSNELRNVDITKRLLALTGRDESAVEHVTDRLGHDFRYAIDSSKIQKELGWKAETPFEEGFEKTVAYYRGR
jgi:dTDP-glucose 4,6-dehydratase